VLKASVSPARTDRDFIGSQENREPMITRDLDLTRGDVNCAAMG